MVEESKELIKAMGLPVVQAPSEGEAEAAYLVKSNKVNLGLKKDLYVTLPIGQYKNLKANASIKDGLRAPLLKGEVYGDLNITLDGKILVSQTLVALEDNPKANFFFRIFDYIKMLF